MQEGLASSEPDDLRFASTSDVRWFDTSYNTHLFLPLRKVLLFIPTPPSSKGVAHSLIRNSEGFSHSFVRC